MSIPPGYSNNTDWHDFRFHVGGAVINFENDDGPRDLVINKANGVQVLGCKDNLLKTAYLVGNKWEKKNDRHRRVKEGEFDWGGDYEMRASEIASRTEGVEGQHQMWNQNSPVLTPTSTTSTVYD
ncbi:unnamed protein product, partial [Amoebophrya sp. A25]|eukprot:GSA25T00020103001.1